MNSWFMPIIAIVLAAGSVLLLLVVITRRRELTLNFAYARTFANVRKLTVDVFGQETSSQEAELMAQPVATVNGRKVYSDKRVSSVQNTKITFSDGSWCDVATGQVVNKGAGYINIDTPQAGSTKHTVNTKTYNASAVELQTLQAAVEVAVHAQPHIEVTIEGIEEDARSIRVSQRGDTLVIQGSESSGQGGISIFSGSGSFRSISVGGSIRGSNIVIGRGGSNIFVGGESEESSTRVSLKVPKGTSISTEDVEGNITVGDTEGSLQATITGSSRLTAGSVTATSLSIQGSGRVNIQQVSGSLMSTVQGSGRVEVQEGQVANLTMSVQGSGRVKFKGEADNAHLTVQGSGDISVRHVKNRPIRNIQGNGSIDVGNW